MADNGAVLLRVEQASRWFGGIAALDEVSLSVPQGARYAVIGPNGAGKTTLFNLIGGQDRPTSGRVFFEGRDITSLPAYRRATLGIARVFQLTTLFPRLTVLENLLLAVQGVSSVKYVPYRPVMRYAQDVARAVHLLDLVGLAGRERVLVSALSYGERRQLEVAMAMASEPRLLLLDEPAAGLARGEAERMVDMLLQLPRSVTILFVEHDMDIAFRLAETIVVLNEGRVIAQGTVEETRNNRLVQEVYLGGVI